MWMAELTLTEEDLAVFSLDETEYIFLPEERLCAFRIAWQRSSLSIFLENYMSIMSLQTKRCFQTYFVLLKLLRLGKDRNSCYTFMPVLSFSYANDVFKAFLKNTALL